MWRAVLLAFSLILGIAEASAQQTISGFGLPTAPQFVTIGLGTPAVSTIGLSITTPTNTTFNNAIYTLQNIAGTAATGINFNRIGITTDTATISGAGHFGVGFAVEHHMGGATVKGDRIALLGNMFFDGGATNAGNTEKNYIGVQGQVVASNADGGTGTGWTTAAGAIFGFAAQAQAQSGATNLLNVAGMEVNIYAYAGSSGWTKEGMTVAPGIGDAVSFTHNMGYTLSTQAPTTPTLDTAFSVNDFHNSSAQGGGNGSTGLKTSGCVLCADSENASLGTIATGIDFSKFTISGNFLKFANGGWTGTGILFSSNNSAAVYPTLGSGTGWAITDNFSSGSAEMSLWNTVSTATTSFVLRQQTGASSNTILMTVSPNGNTAIGGTVSAGVATLTGITMTAANVNTNMSPTGTSTITLGPPAGQLLFANVSTGTNADFLCMAAGGAVLIQASACTISSMRFKNLIGGYGESSLGVIGGLKPIVFTMKGENADRNYSRPQIGLSAENVAAVEPRCAIYEDDGVTPKSYRQECLIAVLAGAIQEQQRELEALRAHR